MTARPRRTSTLVGPDRLILAAATTGLVALASGATALLVLTGTSTVSLRPAPSMPLSTPSPVRSPGVIVLPPDQTSAQPRAHHPAAVPPRAVPAALAFVAPAAPAAPVVPAVVPAAGRVPPTPAVTVPVVEPPYVPTPDVTWPDDGPDVPGVTKPHADAGQHLARGHAKHAKPGRHGKHAKHEKYAIPAKHHRTRGVAVHEQDD
jgi:hypothetical protein